MSLVARPGTALLVATASGENGGIEVLRYPVYGFMVVGGYLTPLTVVPPIAMPPGRHGVFEPESEACGESVVDLKAYQVFNSADDWEAFVTPGLAAGEAPTEYASTPSAALPTGPGIRDNAPGVDDPERPKRARRTKAEMEAARKAEEEAKALAEAKAQTDTTAALTEGATAAPAAAVVEDDGDLI